MVGPGFFQVYQIDHENTLSSGIKQVIGRESMGSLPWATVPTEIQCPSLFRFLYSFLAETVKDLGSITLGLRFLSNHNRCAPLNLPSKPSVLQFSQVSNRKHFSKDSVEMKFHHHVKGRCVYLKIRVIEQNFIVEIAYPYLVWGPKPFLSL